MDEPDNKKDELTNWLMLPVAMALLPFAWVAAMIQAIVFLIVDAPWVVLAIAVFLYLMIP